MARAVVGVIERKRHSCDRGRSMKPRPGSPGLTLGQSGKLGGISDILLSFSVPVYLCQTARIIVCIQGPQSHYRPVL